MKTPVIFVHGLWLHSSSWDNWLKFFNEAAYDTIAPGWPGEHSTVADTRKHIKDMEAVGINDIVEHYKKIISSLPAKPIVIGHSFGGLIAQKLLGMDLACAAVAIDAAPIKGVLALPFSALRVASVALKSPFNWSRTVSLTGDQFHYGFTNTLSKNESDALYHEWVIPSTARPLFQVAVANLALHSEVQVETKNNTRGPLLLIAGGKDRTVPAVITRSTLKLYRNSKAVTDFKEFIDRDHSLAINSRGNEVAAYILGWLKQQGL